MSPRQAGWFVWCGCNTAHFFVAGDAASICSRGYSQPLTAPWIGLPQCGQCARRLAAKARLQAGRQP